MSWFPVAPDEIVDRWRPLESDEAGIIDKVIGDAQDILEDDAEAEGISMPTTERGQRAYVRAVANMVIRVLKNPDGILTETVDGYMYRRDSAVSSGALVPTDDEIGRLRPIVRRRRGAFTIVPS